MGDDLRAFDEDRTQQKGRTGAVTLAGAWALVAAGAFLLGDAAQMRFLDLPLGAYLAGQGAVMAAAVVAFRVTGADSGER